MNTADAFKLAMDLMAQHKLPENGWTFQWSYARHQFGLCSYRHKLIRLSRKLTELNNETQVRDTILHEIAHVLVGRGHHHGPVWKLKAIEVGAKPEACYSTKEVVMPTSTYHGICRDCGVKIPRVRRPSRSVLISAYHPKCRWDKNRGKIDWYCHGVKMHGLIESVPAPGVFEHHDTLPVAAQKLEPVKTDLTQSDISEMWERLNKIVL